MPLSDTATPTQVTDAEIDRRIIFHDDLQIIEFDLTGFNFDGSAITNRFYDRVEDRIAESGEALWFFLVNLSDTRIDHDAWFSYSRRGKALNLAHSMGSTRFDPSEVTRRQIAFAADTEAFDPNLFTNRDDALARLKSLPSKRRKFISHDPSYTRDDFVKRLSFDAATEIMEVDLSGFVFYHSRDVDDFYDYVAEERAATGRKWFFLINMNGCEIHPAAWVRYSHRGKQLNIDGSLGTVRYATGSETEETIRMRAESQGFRPNVRNTRDEALARLDEIKAEAATAQVPPPPRRHVERRRAHQLSQRLRRR